MNTTRAYSMNADDIKAHGPAPDGETLSLLLARLADLAADYDNLMLWGWLCAIRDMPDEIAEVQEIPRLETVRDAKGTDQTARSVIDAAISILRRP